MMWKEFEELAGYEVTYSDYHDIIEPMYMAIPDSISKAEFVKMIDKKRFAIPTAAELLRDIKKEARHLFDICGHCSDFESEKRLQALAKQYAKRKWGIDWDNDIKSYVYILPEYKYPKIQKGCTFPKTLIIGRDGQDYERITLVKC